MDLEVNHQQVGLLVCWLVGWLVDDYPLVLVFKYGIMVAGRGGKKPAGALPNAYKMMKTKNIE